MGVVAPVTAASERTTIMPTSRAMRAEHAELVAKGPAKPTHRFTTSTGVASLTRTRRRYAVVDRKTAALDCRTDDPAAARERAAKADRLEVIDLTTGKPTVGEGAHLKPAAQPEPDAALPETFHFLSARARRGGGTTLHATDCQRAGAKAVKVNGLELRVWGRPLTAARCCKPELPEAVTP